MEFRLNHTPKPFPFTISHKDPVLLIGSCFAENIGEYLVRDKFDCKINPNGILFNPISIANALTSYMNKSESFLIVKGNEFYQSLNHHGDFSFSNENELKDAISKTHHDSFVFLKECKCLILTFGSAFTYRHLKLNTIVANCHKLPQSEFRKELLKTEEIVKVYADLLKDLKTFNPDLKIILTVSPVMYLRDGVEQNTLSKSILIQSVHELVEKHSNCFYFPAFELVNDDLRDYRFYKEDLAHPNNIAIKYVWNKFSEVAFSKETLILIEKIEEIVQAASHRPINESSISHQQFKKNYLQRCLDLEKEFPNLDLSKEKLVFGN
jgi:hypothetical protein